MNKINLLAIGVTFSAAAFAQVPVLGPIIGPSSTCQGKTAYYSITASNSPTTYHWSVSPSGGITIANPSTSQIYVIFPTNGADSTSYSVRCYATNASGNSPQQTKAVWAEAIPQFTCTRTFSACAGAAAMMKATPATTINYSYQWAPAADLNTATGATVIANLSATTVFTVNAYNGACKKQDTLTLRAEACVGLNSILSQSTEELLVYPNPSNGEFTIRASSPGAITLINGLGQIERNVQVTPDSEIRITGLSPGIYYLQRSGSRRKLVVTSRQ